MSASGHSAAHARHSHALWIVVAVTLLLGCRARPPEPPHLVLVVIDTLRADHVGAYGHPRPTSPRIDRLARAGSVFTRALATSSWTRPSIASLFTSRPPSEHGAIAFDRAMRSDLPTLAEHLGDAGYRTVGVSGNFVHVNAETGLARGFDEFEVLSPAIEEGSGDVLLRIGKVAVRAPSAEEVNRAVLSRLPESAEAPLFLYVHYMEPHAGYLPREPFLSALALEVEHGGASEPATSDRVVALAQRAELPEPAEIERLRALYDGEVAAVDHAVGELLDALEQRGFADNAIVVVVSDHGEEFGEHGGLFHGITLYDESLRVPLVIHDARHPTDGLRRDEPVDLLDVAPTLLALAGLPPGAGMHGRSLAPGTPLSERSLVAELHPDPTFEDHLRPRTDALALVRWPWKVIVSRNGAVRGYRLDDDPAESSPLGRAALPPALVGEALERSRRTAEMDVGSPLELDAERRMRLRALGYAE